MGEEKVRFWEKFSFLGTFLGNFKRVRNEAKRVTFPKLFLEVNMYKKNYKGKCYKRALVKLKIRETEFEKNTTKK